MMYLFTNTTVCYNWK